jgi:hypothetical protein
MGLVRFGNWDATFIRAGLVEVWCIFFKPFSGLSRPWFGSTVHFRAAHNFTTLPLVIELNGHKCLHVVFTYEIMYGPRISYTQNQLTLEVFGCCYEFMIDSF